MVIKIPAFKTLEKANIYMKSPNETFSWLHFLLFGRRTRSPSLHYLPTIMILKPARNLWVGHSPICIA